MPLIVEAHNPFKGPWVLQDLPEVHDTELYWFIPYTGEAFSCFDQFTRRVELYNSRVWSCRITGKSSLTYQEALASERDMTESLQGFPKTHLKLLLEMVHGNQEHLDVLSNKICKKLQQIFEPDDVVRWKGKTVEVVGPVDEENTTENTTQTKYTVTWKDKRGEQFVDTASSSGMIRKDFSITVANVRHKIREVANRKKYKSAPWLVDDEILQKYEVNVNLTEEVANLVKHHEGGKSKKVKRRPIVTEDLGNDSKRRKIQPDPQDEMKKEYQTKLERMFPLEDLTLLHLEGSSTPSLPDPTPFDYPIEEVYFLDALVIWRFLTFFSRSLSLYPFSFEDFLKSLINPDAVTIIDQTIICLLESLDFKTAKPLTADNWEASLRKYFREANDREVEVPTNGVKMTNGHHISSPSESSSSPLQTDDDDDDDDDPDATLACEEEDLTMSPKLNGMIIESSEPIDSSRRKERVELGEVLNKSTWRILSTADRILILRLLCDDSLNYLSESSLRKSLEVAIEKKSSLQKEKWLTSREMNQKVRELEDTFQSKNGNGCEASSSSSEELKDPKKIRKLELAKKQHQELKTKKTESLTRQIEKFHIREQPLGYDRWYNRYWYFPEIPEMLFMETSPYYCPETQKSMMEKGPVKEKNPSVLETEYEFPGDDVEKLESNLIYFSTKQQLDQVYQSLNEKGVREKKLLNNLTPCYHKILANLGRKEQEALREAIGESVVRRSSRIKTTEKLSSSNGPFESSYLTYVNFSRK